MMRVCVGLNVFKKVIGRLTRFFASIFLSFIPPSPFPPFEGHMLHELVRDCAIVYLEDDNPEIRKASAVTTCQLLIKDPIAFQTSSHAMQIVSEVLEKLLIVGITDPGMVPCLFFYLPSLLLNGICPPLLHPLPLNVSFKNLKISKNFLWLDPLIRQTVLESLDERFDHHLAQAENVRSLFIALNDEVFAIRELTITIIGRLTLHNPAYVMPSLRKTLIQLLTELEYSGVRYESNLLFLFFIFLGRAEYLRSFEDYLKSFVFFIPYLAFQSK